MGFLSGKGASIRRTARTPTILQMEAAECGAASLGMILAYHGRFVPLEELRLACGVSRDGSNAKNMVMAARTYGLEAKGYRWELSDLQEAPLPSVLFWEFNHFVVLQGFEKGHALLNDPAVGPRTVTMKELDQAFTGVALTFSPGPDFKKDGREPSIFPSLRRRLKGSETALLFVVIAGLALVGPGLAIPTFARIFIDDYLVNNMTDWLRPLLAGLALTALMRGALMWLQQSYLVRLETKLRISGSAHFLWHALRLPVEFYTQRYAGDIACRFAINRSVARLLGGQFTGAIIDTLMAVFYAAVMLAMNFWLALAGILMVALNAVVGRVVQRVRVDRSRRLLREEGRLNGVSMGGMQSIETLKATGSESDFFAVWSGHQTKFVNTYQDLQSATIGFLEAPIFLGASANALVLLLGGYLVMKGQLTLGILVALQSLLASLTAPVNRLMNLLSSLQELRGQLFQLDDVMDYPVDPRTEEVLPAPGTAEDRSVTKLSGEVDLRGVTFGYSRLSRPLIEGFDLAVKPGRRAAFVGPSGCGKSTLARLLAGLYAPWGGEILFDDVPRSRIPRAAFAKSVAFVDQDIALVEGTIRDNLTLWDPTIPDDALVRACTDACVHDDIMALPGGLDAVLTEGGVNLSGGQRQRLEIARALVRDPSLLVRDEATSSLDVLTEVRLDRNLRARGCTCIIIAQRLSTIRDADEIVVLEKGKVVQRGRHEDLCGQAGGLYAALIGE